MTFGIPYISRDQDVQRLVYKYLLDSMSRNDRSLSEPHTMTHCLKIENPQDLRAGISPEMEHETLELWRQVAIIPSAY